MVNVRQPPLFGPTNLVMEYDVAGEIWIRQTFTDGRSVRYGAFASSSRAQAIYERIASSPNRLWTREELGIGRKDRHGRKR